MRAAPGLGSGKIVRQDSGSACTSVRPGIRRQFDRRQARERVERFEQRRKLALADDDG